MTREEAAKACPQATEFVRRMRNEFPGLQVLYVEENGHTFGSVPAWREDEDRRPD